MNSLQPLVEDFYQHHKLVGLCAAVVRGQQDIEIGAAGVRRAGSSERVTTSDQWHIGSNAKSITAFLCARQVELGKIDWHTSLSDVMGDMVANATPETQEVTLIDLLAHRSGVRDRGLLSWIRQARRDGRSSTEQRLQLAKRLLAGAKWPARSDVAHYSNFGYCLAAAMLERAAGASWEDMVRAELFLPFGMSTAGFGAPGADGGAQPWGHAGFFRSAGTRGKQYEFLRIDPHRATAKPRANDRDEYEPVSGDQTGWEAARATAGSLPSMKNWR
jgi:CubicO group peptidase (beta-lactamase class C family)